MAMSKRKPSRDPSFKKLKADYYPVQRSMDLRSTATEVDYYILDVGRNLSVQNKRLYRQGKTYVCKVDLQPGHVSAQYDVYALVDTWYVQKAWQLAKATYDKATADERSVMTGQQIARWEDFRIQHGLSGHAGGELVPAPYSNGLASVADTAGEFALSRITLADGTTNRFFTWGATSGGNLGVLEEYDKSGDTDNSPSTTSASKAYAGTDANVTENQMDAMSDNGNAPPYDATAMNPRVWVRIARLDAAAAHGKLSTGYFNAPCGLIAVQPSVSSTAIVNQLSLTVQGGNYKGVKAHNMGV
jgi:hypothetical protein